MDRKKRVQRLKRLIVVSGLVILFVPSLLAICFFTLYRVSVNKYNDAVNELNYYLENRSEQEFVENTLAIENETTPVRETSDKTSNLTKQEVEDLRLSTEEAYFGYRKVYLTFDDGPSPYTDDILEILKEYDVKATFFVVRRDGRNNEKLYQQIVNEGHSLGMHSTSHIYKEIYKDVDSFKKDTKELRDFLYMVTGVESNLYRFPGGSSNQISNVDMKEFAKVLYGEGITYFDWNISSQDASSVTVSKDQIVRNVTGNLSAYNEAVILFHDLDTKGTTVQALPEIIEYIQSMDNTVLLPITEDTNPIQHLSVVE